MLVRDGAGEEAGAVDDDIVGAWGVGCGGFVVVGGLGGDRVGVEVCVVVGDDGLSVDVG